jgi:hypothetical protein
VQKWFDYLPETLNHVTSIDDENLVKKLREVILGQTDQNVDHFLKLLVH